MRKKNRLLVVLAVLGVLIGAFLVYVAVQPTYVVIEREVVIAAPPEVVYAHIEDLRQWDAWSPWAKLDPQALQTFEGAPKGVGAIMKWSGNDQVGSGQMTIVKAEAPKSLVLELKFIKPWEGKAKSLFVIAATDEKRTTSRVVWGMNAERGFVEKLVNVLMDVDGMIGADYEKGLAGLKAVAEKQAAPVP